MPHLLRHVWHLVIWDEELSHGDYKELFSIGVFSSRFRAWRTAKRYLQRVPGFRDHPCRYSITRRAVRGVAVKGSCIRCVLGWNLNADGDEIDLVYSEFFSHRRMLYETMDRMRRHMTGRNGSAAPTGWMNAAGRRALTDRSRTMDDFPLRFRFFW